MKAGRSDQKTGPKLKSKPGQPPPAGNPIHGASITRWMSYSPKNEATMHPTTIPMIGTQRRHTPETRSASITMTNKVAIAHAGAAAEGVPSGTSANISKTIGITVTAINMITVPATVGVMIRRNSESRVESANWNNDEMTTRVASIAGPPLASAVTQTAINAPEVPMRRT